VDVKDTTATCGLVGGAAAGHAAGAAAREEAGATMSGLSAGTVDARDRAMTNTQPSGAIGGACSKGSAGVSVTGDVKGGGAAEDVARLGWTVT